MIVCSGPVFNGFCNPTHKKEKGLLWTCHQATLPVSVAYTHFALSSPTPSFHWATTTTAVCSSDDVALPLIYPLPQCFGALSQNLNKIVCTCSMSRKHNSITSGWVRWQLTHSQTPLTQTAGVLSQPRVNFCLYWWMEMKDVWICVNTCTVTRDYFNITEETVIRIHSR